MGRYRDRIEHEEKVRSFSRFLKSLKFSASENPGQVIIPLVDRISSDFDFLRDESLLGDYVSLLRQSLAKVGPDYVVGLEEEKRDSLEGVMLRIGEWEREPLPEEERHVRFLKSHVQAFNTYERVGDITGQEEARRTLENHYHANIDFMESHDRIREGYQSAINRLNKVLDPEEREYDGSGETEMLERIIIATTPYHKIDHTSRMH